MSTHKKLILVVMVVFISGIAFAKQEYNVMEDRWETVPDDSDWSPQYNVMENTWSIQPDDAEIEYNVMEDKWEWDSGKNENR